MKQRKLKVYGGHLFGSQFGMRGSRVIVAAHSWKETAELLDTSLSHIKTYWSITYNEYELKLCFANPLMAFYVPDDLMWKKEPPFKMVGGQS